MKHGRPRIGALLLGDESSDSNVGTDLDAIHEVGVFAPSLERMGAKAGSC